MSEAPGRTGPPGAFDALAHAAEGLLSEVLGRPAHFVAVERISEPDRSSLVLRGRLSETSDGHASVIIKQLAADLADPNDFQRRRFLGDWAGNQFLSGLGEGARHGPRFYGGSQAQRFVILEDLGEQHSLVEPLLHGDPDAAESALLRYSARLGQMHADTANRASEFEALARRVDPAGRLFDDDPDELGRNFQQALGSLESLGVQAEPACALEASAILGAVARPGPFLVYIHDDPCPDNVFDRADELRLIDFEYGHFGHALIDATHPRMCFPTCWCANRLPAAVVEKIERRYRAELMRGCPAAADDRVFERELVMICGLRVLNTLHQHLAAALAGDEECGIATTRPRILARLEAFITASSEFGHLPGLRGLSERLRDVLVRRWPDSAPLPLYPAFRQAATSAAGG